MKKVKDKHPLYKCPECDSNNLIVKEVTSYYLNGMYHYRKSVKAHDSNAKVECLNCGREGHRGEFEDDV